MLPLWICFWDQYSRLFKDGILKKLVTWIRQDDKNVKMSKSPPKMILTGKGRAKHPFTGQNTQRSKFWEGVCWKCCAQFLEWLNIHVHNSRLFHTPNPSSTASPSRISPHLTYPKPPTLYNVYTTTSVCFLRYQPSHFLPLPFSNICWVRWQFLLQSFPSW